MKSTNEVQSKHTPFPWTYKKVPIWAPTKPTEGIPVFEFCFTGGEEWMRTARSNARLIAAAPELLESLRDCLAQLEGPAMVYGDGRGNDGQKTGLSHAEFNQLRAERLNKARAAIAKAEGRAE